MPTLLETQGRPCVAFLGENPSMICLIQWLIYEKKIRNHDSEGWYGEGGGFRMGKMCIPVADSR